MVTSQTSGEYFKVLRIIHASLIMGLIFFTAVAFSASTAEEPQWSESPLTRLLLMITFGLSLAGIFLGNYFYKQKSGSAAEEKELKDKMLAYRSALIIRFALLEAPALFAAVSFLLTSYWLFLAILGFLIAFLVLIRPSREKVIGDLGLDQEEEALIRNPEAIITEFEGSPQKDSADF